MGGQAVYDTDLDITWVATVDKSQSYTWQQAIDWAGNLDFLGYTDWRLPSGSNGCFNDYCTGSELGHLFYSELGGSQNLQIRFSTDPDLSLFPGMTTGNSLIWSGDLAEFFANTAVYFDFETGYQTGADSQGGATRFVMAVRDGDVGNNMAPTAEDSKIILAETETVSHQLTSSDSDGDPLTFTLEGTGPTNGTVTIATDGSYTFTPDIGFTGLDSFQFRVSDGIQHDIATVNIEVGDGNSQLSYTGTTANDVLVSGDGVMAMGNGEFQVNTTTFGQQDSPSITTLNDGSFVVVWASGDENGFNPDVYMQHFDASANPLGIETVVNTTTGNWQYKASASSLIDGGFVVTWQSNLQDGSQGGIYAQRFDNSANPVGVEFQVNTTTEDGQALPSVSSLIEGGFVVTWHSHAQDGSFNGIFGQLYDAFANPVGIEFQVNATSENSQDSPSVSSLIEGGFVVTWNSNIQDGSKSGIFAQRFNAQATPIGPEFRVNTYTTDDQYEPSVSSLVEGGFVITWHSNNQEDTTIDTYAQRYDALGNPIGGEFRVNTTMPGNQANPSVTSLTGGGFVIIWDQQFIGDNIHSQRYDHIGNAIGSEFVVNTHTANGQQLSAITALESGGFVVTWGSYLQDGSASGIYAQRYNAAGNPVGGTIQAGTADDIINGNAGDDLLAGREGNDTINGGDGNDIASYLGVQADYTVVDNGNGNYTVTDNNASDRDEGTDTLTSIETIRFTDGDYGGSSNTAPIANDDASSVDEDSNVSIAVLTNDTDAESDPLSISSFTQGTNGAVSQSGNDLIYTPNPDFSGSDSFQYTANDGTVDSNLATVTVIVNPINDVPIAVDDSATSNEDLTLSIGVLSNDTDVDGDSLTIASVTQGDNGGSVINQSTHIDYTPALNFNGVETFSYSANDGTVDSNSATVTITVTAVNDAPTAVDDSTTTNEDSTVTVGVLANDSDPDGDALSISAVTQGSNGTVVNNGTDVTYTPNLNFNGSDSFTYTIDDGNGGSDSATVTITVTAINDNPDAVDDSTTTNEDTLVTVDVLTNDSDLDGDALSISTVTQGSNGTVVNNGTDVSYTPNSNFNGSDSFTYTIDDGNGGNDTATVTVTINPINDVPVAVNDNTTTNEDTVVTIDVMANDSDPDGDLLSIQSFTQGSNGTVSQNGNNLDYLPNNDFNGNDSFTYIIDDGNGSSDTATVNITVSAVNDAPIAVNDSATTDQDAAITVDVLANDSDADGDTLTISSVTQGSNGSVVNNGTDVTYTPNAGFFGTDSFQYTANDGVTDSQLVTVTITVNDVDTPSEQITNLQTVMTNIPLSSFTGPNNKANENRQNTLLNRLASISDSIDVQDYQAAIDQLRKMDGLTDSFSPPTSANDWISGTDAQTINGLVNTLINDLLTICGSCN